MRRFLAISSMVALLFATGCGEGSSSSNNNNNNTSKGDSSSCTSTIVPVGQQLRNPVSAFPLDNNGVIIQFPSISTGGASSAQGALVFGIGTEPPNNSLGSAPILTLDTRQTIGTVQNPNYGGFTTLYNGKQCQGSFIDAGSNGIFFLDQPTSGIPDCTGSNNSWYCPTTGTGQYLTETLNATNEGFNSNSSPVQFSVSNASRLPVPPSTTAFSDLAGPLTPGSPNAAIQAADAFFDWGLSFFYGKNVYTSINGINAYGAYWAYCTFSALSSGNNVATLAVDAGPVPTSNPQQNVAYVTVTVCAPGSTICQTIGNVAVDTGSIGLRIPYSVLNSTLAAALTNVNPSSPLAECIQFLDNSFLWGSVKYADVKMGVNNNSEVAASIPIHVMGDPAVESLLPSTCSTLSSNLGVQNVPGTEEDTVNALGANGLLGVGSFQYDCDYLPSGNACTTVAVPSMYYACSQ